MFAVLAAVAVVKSPSTGITWVAYATFGLVSLGAVIGFLRWLKRDRFALYATWTDKWAEPEVEHRGTKEIVAGGPAEVFVRIRPLVPFQLGRLDVRLQQDHWHWEWPRPRYVHPPRHVYEPAPLNQIRVEALRDGNRFRFKEGGGRGHYPRELTTSFHRQDKSLLIGEYSPVWPVGADDAVILGVTVHAFKEWTGLLTLSFPNAVGRRVWKRLRLKAVLGP